VRQKTTGTACTIVRAVTIQLSIAAGVVAKVIAAIVVKVIEHLASDAIADASWRVVGRQVGKWVTVVGHHFSNERKLASVEARQVPQLMRSRGQESDMKHPKSHTSFKHW
jgi:hypothetical protein